MSACFKCTTSYSAAFSQSLPVRLLPSTRSAHVRLCKRPRTPLRIPPSSSVAANLPPSANGAARGISNGTANGSSLAIPSPPTPKSPTSRFLTLLWQNKKLLIPALFLAFLGSTCSILQPLLFGRIIGVISRTEFLEPGEARALLFARTAKLCGVYLIELLCTLGFVTLMSRIISDTTRKLREMTFEKVMRNDVGFFDREGRTQIVNKLSDEIRTVRNGVWDNLGRDRGLRAIMDCIFGISLSFYITGAIGIPVFGILVPIISTLVAQMGLRNGRVAARVGIKDGRVRNFLDERMRGIRTVKAFGAERREGRMLRVLLGDVGKGERGFGISKALTEIANRVSIYVTIVMFFIMGGLLICSGKLTFELFSSVTGYIWILNFAMQGVSYTITDVTKVGASLKNIYGLLDSADGYEGGRKEGGEIVGVNGAEVEFRNVGFAYPSRPEARVISGISFSIQRGEMVALVGDSGGGKSTIAAMLSRFYKPVEGVVMLDGKDIHSLDGEAFARQIAVVDQEPVMFQGTVRENIAYGLPDDMVDDERIVQAAKEANAHEFICKLSKGYDTVWTPGSNLSGGQRQRIAIARSLLKRPAVLVWDEATSALDEVSMRLVQGALEKVRKDRAVLIIAHRLSTVKKADRILFVKEGKIVERGSFDELVKKEGYFSKLVQSSSEGVETSSRII